MHGCYDRRANTTEDLISIRILWLAMPVLALLISFTLPAQQRQIDSLRKSLNGRRKASEIKNKSTSWHKSIGMKITADRIAILQPKNKTDTSITIHDLVLPDGSGGGTEVFLKIPLII